LRKDFAVTDFSLDGSTFLAGGLLAGLLAASWQQLKALLHRLTGLLVVRAELGDRAGHAVAYYLWTRGRPSPWADRSFTGDVEFVRPAGRYLVTAWETLGTEPRLFWLGWRPLQATVRIGTADKPTLTGTPTQLRYLRGTFNLDALVAAALAAYNDASHGVGGDAGAEWRLAGYTGQGNRNFVHQPHKVRRARIARRFRVEKLFGAGRAGAFGHQADAGAHASPKLAEGPDAGAAERLSRRYLVWAHDDIGAEIPAGDPLAHLALPPEAWDLVAAAERWADSEAWFKSRRVPWRLGVLLEGSPGTGKCLGAGTPVLMFDGTTRPVEDVRAGDLLMGPDSRPRRVRGLTRGRGELFRVTPVKGEPYVVNRDHVLSLKMNGSAAGYRKGQVVNVPVGDYLAAPENFRHRAKGWRTGVEFSAREVPIDPYFLGLWLGDGTTAKPVVTTPDAEVLAACEAEAASRGMRLTGAYPSGKATTVTLSHGRTPGVGPFAGQNTLFNALRALGLTQGKFVPHCYKANSRAVRLQLLAGLIDADGYASSGGYDVVQKRRVLADDIAWLARSLGLAAYVKPAVKRWNTPPHKGEGLYWRVYISGDANVIPVRVPRRRLPPRRQVKDVLVTGLAVESIGEGDYYGFEVDGDHLFLLGDFTVTHNSALVGGLARRLDLPVYAFDLGTFGNKDFVAAWQRVLNSAPCLALIEDVDAVFHGRDNVLGDSGGGLSFDCLLNCLSGVEGADGVLVVVTTNKPDLLDAALGRADGERGVSTRPGRLDRVVRLGPLDEAGRRHLAGRILADCPDEIERLVAAGAGDTGAQFQERCAQIALADYWAKVGRGEGHGEGRDEGRGECNGQPEPDGAAAAAREE
jgi:hypothetical protein